MATQVIYKSGSKWILNGNSIPSGSCVVAETGNGLGITIKLVSNLTTISSGLYTEYVDANGTAYGKTALLVLLDDFLNVAQNGTPAILEVELTRPDNTTEYAAGDAMGAAAASVKKVCTVTLTGTGGVAAVSCGGLTEYATFATSPTQTATNFVTDFATGYAELDIPITLTSSGPDLIFTAENFDEDFETATIANSDGNLFGTIAHSQANVTAVKQKEIITLTGTDGKANVTGAGGLTKLVTFATTGDADLAQTAADFAASWAEDYLAEGIVLTAATVTLVFEAQTAGTPFTAPVITNVTEDLAGTVAHTTANRVAVKQIETITFTGTMGTIAVLTAGGLTKALIFSESLATTISIFYADFAADYLAQGIVLSKTDTQIIMTANVAGTGFTAPTLSWSANDLDGTVATTDMVSLAPLVFANAGSGVIMGLKVETDIVNMAGKDLRLWFYNAVPTEVVGDNVALVTLYANKSVRLFYIDVTMDALLTNADNVVGLVDLAQEYVTTDGNLYLVVQTLSVFVPTEEGNVTVGLNVIKL